MRDINEVFGALSKSRFRSRFKLAAKDLRYLEEKGIHAISAHAREFIIQRLAPAKPRNDGKQTPFRGHPVFTAQHATATCCRKCLAKWHSIEIGKELNDEQVDYITEVIMRWIERQR